MSQFKLLALLEARDPSLKYTEKQVKNTLDRVTVELKANQAGAMSRLTKRYERLDKAAKLLQERRDAVNAQMKEKVEDLFDASDVVLTRVVETASCTITLSKAERGETKEPKVAVDYKAIVKELSEMVPELEEKLRELTLKFTKITPATDTPAALRVKVKVDEGISEMWAGIKKLIASIKSWATGFDSRLEKLKAVLK